jgi:hypothetical protein
VEPTTLPNLKHTPFVVFFDIIGNVIGNLTPELTILSSTVLLCTPDRLQPGSPEPFVMSLVSNQTYIFYQL